MGTVTVIIFSLTKSFRVFTIVGFILGAIVVVFIFLFVPESPRYYIAVGKPEKAIGVYKYLAKLHPDPNVKL